MKDLTAGIIGILAVFVLALGLMWVVEGNEFFLRKYFAPKEEALRRKTFEESKAYNDGMAQELRAMQLDHIKANSEQKKAICSIALHRVASYETQKLPNDVYAFVSTCEREAGIH